MTATVYQLAPRVGRNPSRPAGTAPVEVDSVCRAVYTVAEVAALLDLSLGSTYALIRSGEIPARKMGGRWVISKRRFHAWLDESDASDEDVPDGLDLARKSRIQQRRGA